MTVAVAIIILLVLIAAAHSGGLRGWWRHATRDRIGPLLDDMPGYDRDDWTRWTGACKDHPSPCADPPCDPEDGWECTRHQPRGKHHAVWQGSLDDQPAAVIMAVVTDAQNRRQ